MIEDALAPVAGDLAELNRLLVSYIPSESDTSARIARHVFSAGGKRIRPAVYFMCCRMLGYRGEHYYPIAAVSEFVHTASLLHDDVLDNSTIRRGKPTANSIYGDEASVLFGDLVYSTASEMMAATGDMNIVRTFARAIRLMSEGELLQLENLFNADLTEECYFKIITCKTAVLIEAACRSAALLARSPDHIVESICRFGRDVGMAFQLIDDALDYAGLVAELGKATLADLAEGKVTMPVLLLRDLAAPSEWNEVTSILKMDEISRDAIQHVAGLVQRYDTVSATMERADQFTCSALEALHKIPGSPARDALENLAGKLLFRFT